MYLDQFNPNKLALLSASSKAHKNAFPTWQGVTQDLK
jgi:hypothetical protein